MGEHTGIATISFESGFMILTDEEGQRLRQPIDFLTADDIPKISYVQVEAITTLANLLVVLIRTLISHGVLDETFLEDGEVSLQDISDIVTLLGGNYFYPDLGVDYP